MSGAEPREPLEAESALQTEGLVLLLLTCLQLMLCHQATPLLPGKPLPTPLPALPWP